MTMYQSPYLRLIPVAGSALALVAIFVALIIAAANDGYYTGGLELPYISETWREGAGYILAVIFVSIASIKLVVVHIAMNKRLSVLESNVPARYFATGCGIIGIAGLFILVIVNTKMNADLHLYAAYAFFVLSILNITTITFLFHAACRRASAGGDLGAQPSLTRSRNIKMFTWALIVINFIIYIPVGVSIICPWNQLPDGNYDYTDCLEIHAMRAATQHLCVWSMLIFYGSYYFDFAPDMFQVAAKSQVQLDNIDALQGVQVVQTSAADYQNPTRNAE